MRSPEAANGNSPQLRRMFATRAQRCSAAAGGLAQIVVMTAMAQTGPDASLAPQADVDRDGFTRRVETLVVTGMRTQSLADLPRSAVVITDDDLRRAPSLNLVDLLAREANLVLRSTAGNDKFSGIDIRGQGDTYGSNVLVMLDGIRLNAEDLSGADYSVVAFDQIAGVDVIRGPNTVRYGNGAVGGVVNIRTRPAPKGTGLELRGRAGSYHTTEAGTDLSWANSRGFISAGADRYNSAGYRDNGFLDKKNLRARAGATVNDALTIALSGHAHRDRYGLPGPSVDFSTAAGRRATNTPEDGGSTNDDRLRADVVAGTAATGQLRMVGVNRERDNAFVITGTPGALREDSNRFDLKYEKSLTLSGREHEVFAGAVADRADYRRRLGDAGALNTATTRGNVRHRAWFAATDIALTDRLRLSAGYRADRFQLQRNDSVVNDVCQNEVVFGTPPNEVRVCLDPGGPQPVEQFTPGLESWRNNALEAGLVYSGANDSRWFVSWAKSFRNPNIDELALAAPGLRPQRGRHLDAGVRLFIANQLELSASLYFVRTRDEILFSIDPSSGNSVNLNATEPTERRGFETELRWYATTSLTLTANAGYTRAQFTNSHAYLPLVPKWTGSLGAQFFLLDGLSLHTTANYVGRRFDGNDFTNRAWPKVPDYQTVDARLNYQRGPFAVYAGIANLFDETYAASVYSNRYYALPGRNYYTGFSYRLSNH